MTRDTRRAGAFLVALGGVVALLALWASPAAADGHHHHGPVSGGAVAIDGSVASGSAHAADDSTASGDATAVDGSVASGCSTAIDDSTASGDGKCDRKHVKHDDKDHHAKPKAAVAAAKPAAATSARLALTGTSSGQLAALAALAVAFGVVLVVWTADRRRVTSQI